MKPVQVSDTSRSSLQPQVIYALTSVRLDWEAAAADDGSLLHQEGSVGLVLFDIVNKLNVPVEEQRLLLGPALFDEITAFVTRQG